MLDIPGAVVTIDAIGCQKKTVQQIVEGNKADYVIACKKNQPGLSDFIEDCFKDADVHGGRYSMSFHKTLDTGEHGRYDQRSCTCIDVSAWGPGVFPCWTGLKTIARVTSIPDSQSGRAPATRYFISSLPCDAKDILGRTRGHWQIENGLHYVLDVTFREDDSRIRKDNGPRNFAVFRRAALALVRNNMASAGDPRITSCRQAVRMAALNPAYAAALFTGGAISCETSFNLWKLYNPMEALPLPSSRNPAIPGFMAGGERRYFHGQLDAITLPPSRHPAALAMATFSSPLPTLPQPPGGDAANSLPNRGQDLYNGSGLL